MKKPLNKISIFLIIAMLWHNAARANPAFSTRLSRDTLRPSVAIGDETLRGALTENAGLPHIISYLPPDTKRTKIIATVGPKNSSEKLLRQMILNGVNVFRFNFSHIKSATDHRQALGTIKHIRRIAQENKRPITILQDLQGPKIRVGDLSKPISVIRNERVFVVGVRKSREKPSSAKGKVIPVDYFKIAEEVKKGQRILIEDGDIELRVEEIKGKFIKCRVVNSGKIEEHKGVNIPDSDLSLRSLTKRDLSDLKFGIKVAGIDMVALSFVRSRKDILDLKRRLKRFGRPNLPIIAKIETPQAVENIDEILKEVYAIMVARGDLAVEIGPEKVPIIQRMLIEKAIEKGIIAIVATQMLESMIESPTPRRSETSDVGRAVMEGADATMLSAETSKGKYPLLAVKTMSKVATATENELDYELQGLPVEDTHSADVSEAITLGALKLPKLYPSIKALVVFTRSGRAALRMAQHRPGVPIVAITPERATVDLLNLAQGVYPVLVSHEPHDMGKFTEYATSVARQVFLRQIKRSTKRIGFPVVLTYGEPGVTGGSDTVRIVNLATTESHKPSKSDDLVQAFLSSA